MSPFGIACLCCAILAAVLFVCATWKEPSDPARLDETTEAAMRRAQRAHAMIRFRSMIFSRRSAGKRGGKSNEV